MDSSRLHAGTDLQNPLSGSERHDPLEAAPPPACPEGYVQAVVQHRALPQAASPPHTAGLPHTALPEQASNRAGHGLSRQDYTLLFNFSRDLLGVGNPAQWLEHVNPAWTTCLGWDAAELTNRAWVEFVHPDDQAATMAAHGLVAQGKTLDQFENRYRCKDGSFKRLSWNVQPTVDTRQCLCVAHEVIQKALSPAVLQSGSNAHLQSSQASLTAGQHRFREIADTFPFVVWTAEPDGCVDYANHVFSDYIGIDQTSYCEVDWKSYVHPEDLPRCISAWQAAIQAGAVYSVDYRLKQAASGQYHWHRVRAAPVRDVAGQVVKWYGTAIDINETKSLEQQAKSFANRLNTTLESITDGFFILDKDWTYTFLNTQAERMLGQTRQELLGKTLWSAFPLTMGTGFEQHYRKAVEEGVSVHFQDYYPAPLDCWFAVSAYPSEEGLAVYFRDVTQTRTDLAQLQLLRTAVSRLDDIIVITQAEPFDEPGPRIIFVNEAFERHTGYTQAEVIGKTPRILQGPKTDRAELARIRSALEAWQPVRAELINYTKSGKEFWLELDIVPIANANGWFTHWVAVERDITERKMAQEVILKLNSELEDRVQQRTQQLQAANKELEAFSYSVSHDLRSPLATINGFSQLLLKSDHQQLSDKGQHYLRRIHAGSTKMGELIEGLLSLAKLSRGELNRQQVDLTAMSSKMVQELRDAEPDRAVDVTVEPDLTVNGDAAMVTVVMQNLIANAWKYSGKTPLARVEIGSETAPDGLRCIFVRDNGAGFDMAYAEKLFEVFQRLHQDTEFKGLGIGLANVKRVVERHGGHIWAQAAPHTGAVFRFTLHHRA